MKSPKKFLSILMALIMSLSTLTVVGMLPVEAAAAPSITLSAVTQLTNNNAQINATVKNPSKAKITKVGFQIGTKSGSWTTTKSEKLNRSDGFTAWYKMSKWYGKLKSNQTYYYRFFITSGGKNKYSSIGSFKTKDDTPKITVNSVTNLTYNNAQINAKISNPYKLKVTKVGFQIGTTSSTWATTKSENISKTGDFTAYYLMSKWYGALKASTKYYYRFFITVDGKNIYSHKNNYPSFTTPKKPANSNNYPPIKALSVSRIVQPANDKSGSCYLSSLATVVTYKKNIARTGGKDYTQGCKVYKEVYKKNGNTTYVYNSTCSYYGLKYVSGGSLQTIYNNLKAGKPVVVYTGSHASVVIGYKGNSNSLSAADFIIMEIKDGCYYKGKLYDKGRWDNSTANFKKANSPSTNYSTSSTCYVTLSSWMSVNGKIKNLLVY